MDDTPDEDHILCPFCGHPGIEAKPGKTSCNGCHATFYIDIQGRMCVCRSQGPEVAVGRDSLRHVWFDTGRRFGTLCLLQH